MKAYLYWSESRGGLNYLKIFYATKIIDYLMQNIIMERVSSSWTDWWFEIIAAALDGTGKHSVWALHIGVRRVCLTLNS